MPARCSQCEEPIERERAMEFLTTCLKCAKQDTTPIVALPVFSHKTAPDILIARGAEQVRQARRANRRAR